jgi:chemotaxis protein histidine kinase CheA
MMSVRTDMMRNLERMFHDMSSELLDRAGEKYGFNASDAKRELLDIKLNIKEKETKKKVDKKEQPKCALPFTGVVRDGDCLGVKFNHGLYTQCWNVQEEGNLCKGCHKQCGGVEPELGLIGARVLKGDEWRDNKGRAPVHYTRVMKKQKLSRDQVMEEAGKFNINVTEEHFEAPEVKRGRPKKEVSDTDSEKSAKRPRGRPKKEAKVVEVDATEDLFASLMDQAKNTKVAEEDAMSDISEGSEVVKVAGVTDKAEKEAAKEAAKQEKEALKLQKQKEREEAKAAKEAAKQEKEALKLQKQKEKEEAKAAKEALKKEKEAAKTKKEDVVDTPILEAEEESEDEEVVVKKFTHNGVTYLKSSKNVLYDMNTQDPIGLWNEKTNSIEECELESDDEEED